MVAFEGRHQVSQETLKSKSDSCSMISEVHSRAAMDYCRKTRSLQQDCRKARTQLHLCPWLLMFLLALLFGIASSAQIVSNDIDSVHIDSPANKEDAVKVNWGVADTSAAVGKVFNFHIPQDAFQGNVHSYTVVESGKNALPSWLTFDTELQALQGVPGPSDKGQYNLEVIAHNDDTLSKATDIFSLVVKDDSPHVSSSKPLKSMGKTAAKAVNCQQGDPVTMVTIVVDTDLDQLLPISKIDLANKLTSHLNIAAEMLKMAPVGDQDKFDTSALVAGPGDAKSSKFSGAFFSWLVGCGKVEPDHMPVLQQVETTSANGEMSTAIGHGIVGWHVTNSRLKPTVKRVRRQVRATATPSIILAPPSKLPVATITSTDKGMGVDPKMTRVVPSMVSPTFSVVQPTEKAPEIKPMSSRERPPKASATAAEIQPTRVVDMEATKTVTTDDGIKTIPDRMYTDKPEMTRSEVLEPSMVMPGEEKTKKTDMLPTTTEMTQEPTGDTRPTGATQVPTVLTTTRAPTTRPTPRRTPRPKTPPQPVHPFPCPNDGIDRNPDVWERIEHVMIHDGEHLRFKIPENAFYDCDDGNTRSLVIDVVTDTKEVIKDKISWLRYDQKKQLLVGLPLAEDRGVYKLLVIGRDSKGAVVRQNFNIEVLSSKMDREVNHEFAFTIDYDYDKFMSDPRNRIDLANRIARLYGDKNPKRMTVTKIERGSVVYSWTNNSLPTDGCPVEDIVDLMGKFLTKNMTLTEEAKRAMGPYTITQAAAVPQGSCANVDFDEQFLASEIKPKATPPYQTVPSPEPKPEGGDDDEVDTSKDDDDSDDIYITTVVPAVVIVAILFIALIIACCLYRKKRKGKMNMQDHHTFVNKGIPVIFPDELQDKPSDSSKPLIMEKEKPPNPPPGYRRSSSESPGSTPPSNHKDHAAATDDQEMDENDVTSPLYRPPPPVTASSENKQPRPHVQPAYRNPPPYVPP
ncbi:dystroglycan 1-like [Liolophura sinensis]|uniref:dystroglycan 1-like n=1 Tax=Liolophura sinensis TaxID=3198878 RepID=UPI003158FE2D